MKVYSTACPRNCYSTCSFKVYVEDNKIVKIDPHPENKATPEGICLKGLSYVERAHSKDRILFPLKKVGNDFVRISWKEAITTITEKLQYLKKEYGEQSVLFLTGSGMSGLLNQFSSNFWKLYGGATTQYGNLCWPAGLEAVRLTLGDTKHNAPWDLENAKLIIMWGKNAAETNIQQMIPVEKSIEKGGKLIVIDPRRTVTADKSHLLVQPVPGTDAFLALTIANIIIENNWHNKEFIQKHVQGFQEFSEHIKKYNVDEAEQITHVPAQFIYALAEDIAKTKPLTIIPGYGMQRFSNGGQTIRALLSLQIITGNIGKAGACFHYGNLQSYIFDEVKEPMSYYPPEKPDGIFRRTVSVAKLGIDILAQKDPEIKMIWVERGNPITQNPDTNTVLKAFRNTEFNVVVEQFMTDTAKEADIILPAKNMFEQSDIIGSYWNPYVQYKPKLIDPAGEVKPETEIYYLLAKELKFIEEDIHRNLLQPDDEKGEAFLKNQVNKFPELDFNELKEKPIIAPGNQDIAHGDFVFPTSSGKIELYSDYAKERWLVNELPDYVPIKVDLPNDSDSFYLLTPNTKNRIHSQFGNLEVIKQFDPEPTIEMNAMDAQNLNISEHDKVEIYNEMGNIQLNVKINLSLKRKCVVVFNGLWISEGGTPNFLTRPMETDMGHGTAFHDTIVKIKKIGS
jgi:anaerobic selenocysteine-containing dehydrogenase